jgi:hypothetical protein
MKMNGSKAWLVPLTGVAFVVVLVIGFIVAGEPPAADEPVQEIVSHYDENKDSVQIGAGLVAIAATFLIFFGGYLRKVLADAEGGGGILSAVVLVGASVIAVGGAIDATISFAIAEAVDDIDPTAVQALQALWDNDFFPIALGTTVFLLASGISIVRHGALPKWLGWVAIVLGVVGVTPIGFVSFLAGGVWILIVSVLLSLRARGPAAPEPTPPTAPPPAPTT